MLDKVEPPSIADGYALSLAFHCLIEFVRSVQQLIDGDKEGQTRSRETTPTSSTPTDANPRPMTGKYCNTCTSIIILK